ncbi:MAG: hypothetical protein P1V81_07795 [Planctomycetota bacterium]|nr:hypothetical protein [Planctomycetota bacterium]
MSAYLLGTLAVTIVLELLVLLLTVRGSDAPRRPAALRTCLFANLFTQPLASYLVMLHPGGVAFVLIEVGVLTTEFLAYLLSGRLPMALALRLAIRTNAITIALSIWLAP